MFTGEMKFVNWRRVELKPVERDFRRNKYKNRVWLTKNKLTPKDDGIERYRRIVGVSRHLLDEAGYGPGTELILVRSKDLFAFKKVGSRGQFRINNQWQIQNQPLYLELSCHTKNNVFDAFVHDGMIIFHAQTNEEVKEENNEL